MRAESEEDVFFSKDKARLDKEDLRKKKAKEMSQEKEEERWEERCQTKNHIPAPKNHCHFRFTITRSVLLGENKHGSDKEHPEDPNRRGDVVHSQDDRARLLAGTAGYCRLYRGPDAARNGDAAVGRECRRRGSCTIPTTQV
jgi:hypothetical protein